MKLAAGGRVLYSKIKLKNTSFEPQNLWNIVRNRIAHIIRKERKNERNANGNAARF